MKTNLSTAAPVLEKETEEQRISALLGVILGLSVEEPTI